MITPLASKLKRCARCGEIKSFDRFYRHAKMKDGLHSHCIECVKDARRIARKNEKQLARPRHLSPREPGRGWAKIAAAMKRKALEALHNHDNG